MDKLPSEIISKHIIPKLHLKEAQKLAKSSKKYYSLVKTEKEKEILIQKIFSLGKRLTGGINVFERLFTKKEYEEETKRQLIPLLKTHYSPLALYEMYADALVTQYIPFEDDLPLKEKAENLALVELLLKLLSMKELTELYNFFTEPKKRSLRIRNVDIKI